MNTWNVFYVLCGSFLANVKILAITKKWLSQKWLYLCNYRKFFSSENFVGILGIRIPCLDASQPLIWLEGAKNFIQKLVYLVDPERDPLWVRLVFKGLQTGKKQI